MQGQNTICFLNGEEISFQEARLPIYDLGIVQGATVTERLRTIRHQPEHVEEHLKRLAKSLALVQFPPSPHVHQLETAIHRVAQANSKGLDPSQDLSIVVFVTAGQAMGDANGEVTTSTPTVCVYSSPLPLQRWKVWHQKGVHLVIPEQRQVPAVCLDPRIKMRSRLHWNLADHAAQAVAPGAIALLLDLNGYLTETSSGNLFLVRYGKLMTPSLSTTLNGISQRVVIDLCQDLGIDVEIKDLSPEDLIKADEVFLTSSTYCLVPVGRVNDTSLNPPIPGPMTKRIQTAWSSRIDFDFVAQATNSNS